MSNYLISQSLYKSHINLSVEIRTEFLILCRFQFDNFKFWKLSFYSKFRILSFRLFFYFFCNFFWLESTLYKCFLEFLIYNLVFENIFNFLRIYFWLFLIFSKKIIYVCINMLIYTFQNFQRNLEIRKTFQFGIGFQIPKFSKLELIFQ